MANFCVTQQQKNSAEYKAVMEKFNITSGDLELILHEYFNNEENYKLFQEGMIEFPPDSYIENSLYGNPYFTENEKLVEIYENHFSKPYITDDYDKALQYATEATKYFDSKYIKIKNTLDNKCQDLITKPLFDNRK